ncbi:MAG TPA: YCF48-related protein [Bryobacteraceae bacterium]|jgi:hypothetical protein|nr:YCF48-related protein [Bryobacteraceae bacterium]
MVKLPQFVLQRLVLRQPESLDHPSADTLTAFGEQRLNNRERGEVLAHLAQCPGCREVLALASVEQPNEPVYLPRAERIAKRRWRHLRWAVPLAAACLLIGIVRIPSPVRKPAPQLTAPASRSSSQQVAAVHHLPEPAKTSATIPAQRARRKPLKIHLLPGTTESTVATVQQAPPAPPPNIVEPATEAKAAAASVPIEEPNLTAGAFLPRQPVLQETAAPAVERQATLRAMPSSLLARLPIEQREKSLWSLDANTADSRGTIEKSADGGKTWQTIRVSAYARLYALAADGSNVWVGGAGGVLFHSADDGLHWTPVIVGDGQVRLSGTITGIESLGGNSIRLKVQSEVGWLTSDGGLHWRRE